MSMDRFSDSSYASCWKGRNKLWECGV